MSPTIRRLMKEAAELSASSPSPSPHFCAYPISDSNLFDWHFTIAGPPSPSPYAGGIYHGRIVLPPLYPLRPPSFRFLTPSGRFEVNREICLSISGHHEESWQPAWGIRTALTAIRSFMDGDAKGQVGGLNATDDVRRMWADKSRSWCCDVCSATDGKRKTNSDILKEWRDVCLQKGIVVDEGGREFVPEGLKMHYKDKTSQEEPSMSTELNQSSIQNDSGASQNKQTTPLISASSTNQPVSRTPDTGPSALSTRPTPTTAITSNNDTPQTPLTTTSTTATTSSDGPWLDRAIIGVLIALVFMMLRRITNTEAT